MKTNEDLKNVYEKAYADGKSYSDSKDSFFTFSTADITKYVIDNVNFTDKTVLEVGCGTGETSFAIASLGQAKKVLGVDYSENAIETCKKNHRNENLEYRSCSHLEVKESFDFIVLQEVIEHVDCPETSIKELVGMLNPGGTLVLTCPNFLNLRGYIWMTLQTLLKVPMSLSDLHFLSPFDFEEICQKNNYELKWKTFSHERVNDLEKFAHDMTRRLTNALRDADLDNSNVENMIQWSLKALRLDNQELAHNGAKGFYLIREQA